MGGYNAITIDVGGPAPGANCCILGTYSEGRSIGYLRDVRRLVETALVQTGRVTRCEHHIGVLLHMGDGGTGGVRRKR